MRHSGTQDLAEREMAAAPYAVTTPIIEFSIIVCSIDERKLTDVSASYTRAMGGASWELIAIRDALSLAEAYNRALERAQGRYVVLSHDDIEIVNDDLASLLRGHLATFDIVGIAGTSRVVAGKWAAAGDPYAFTLITSPDPVHGGWVTALIGGQGVRVAGIQALDGVFMAAKREVAQSVKFDAETFDGFHLYDLDFSFRAYRQGYRLAVCRDIVLIHMSVGTYDAVWERYRRCFEDKHRSGLEPLREALEGARASFSSRSKDDIKQRCQPARVAQVIASIQESLEADSRMKCIFE